MLARCSAPIGGHASELRSLVSFAAFFASRDSWVDVDVFSDLVKPTAPDCMILVMAVLVALGVPIS